MFDNAQIKILLLEDDEEYRRMLFTAFGYNYEIIEGENGEMAMEKILFHKPNIVILDIMMPKVDGFQVLQRIRTYPDQEIAKIPVVVLTNLNNPDDVVKAHDLGANEYFVKSETQMQQVVDAVGNILTQVQN